MKFQHNSENVRILKISCKRMAPKAASLNAACKRLHFHDDPTKETQATDLAIIRKLSQYRNEFSVGLRVVNANGEPFWVNSYSLKRFSDKKNVSNLSEWIKKHVQVGQNARISYFKTEGGYLLTNVQKPEETVDYTQFMPGLLKHATISAGDRKNPINK